MNDVFISYSNEDLDKVTPIAQTLQEQGWSIWWDPQIPFGKRFDDAIETALDSSKCILVVWSKNSIKSNWVKTEAAEGMRRNILVPILLDDVIIPLEFRRIQTARLANWARHSQSKEFDKLLDTITLILSQYKSVDQKKKPIQDQFSMRLLDLAREVVISESDCQTILGVRIIDLRTASDILEPAHSRLVGRVAADDVIEPRSSKRIVEMGGIIDEEMAQRIREGNIESIRIRSILFCESPEGICAKCYGIDPKSSKLVNVGKPVGLAAAKNILKYDISGPIQELLEAKEPQEPAIVAEFDGVVSISHVTSNDQHILVANSDMNEEKTYPIPKHKHCLVNDGELVRTGQRLCNGPYSPNDILAIFGPSKAQEYVINELRTEFRRQGARVIDRDLEIFIRQMSSKIRIADPGDMNYHSGEVLNKAEFLIEIGKLHDKMIITQIGNSSFRRNQWVDKRILERENLKLIKAEKKPAKARSPKGASFYPLLLGITQV